MAEDEKVNVISAAKAALEWLAKPQHVLVVVLVSGAMLFLPNSKLSLISIDGFVKQNRSWIGLAFIISTGLFLVNLGSWVIEKVTDHRAEKKLDADQFKLLSELTSSEKGLLNRFVSADQNSIMLPVEEPVAAVLVGKGILQRGGVGTAISFPFMVQPWAWRLLKENPDLLTGAAAYKPYNRFGR